MVGLGSGRPPLWSPGREGTPTYSSLPPPPRQWSMVNVTVTVRCLPSISVLALCWAAAAAAQLARGPSGQRI